MLICPEDNDMHNYSRIQRDIVQMQPLSILRHRLATASGSRNGLQTEPAVSDDQMTGLTYNALSLVW